MTTSDTPERRPSRQGRMLRQYREDNGLTYADLRLRMQERMDWACSEGALKNFESGRTQRPYIKVRKAITSATGWDHNLTWAD